MQPVDSSFNRQTIRMIVRATLGGDQVRIRLSNSFGNETLRIEEAHVALHEHGPTIVPGTDRPLTFSGRTSISIPPGAYLISDPVRLQVPPLGHLAITVYVPEGAGMATGQGVGLRTTYISPPGNFTEETIMPVASTTSAYYWLAEVYVARSAPAELIVAFGDSITNGYSSTTDADGSWPSVLGQLLLHRLSGTDVSVINEGVGGNRILLPSHDSSSSNALARFERDALDHPGVSTVIFLEGINDIGSTPTSDGKFVTAADLEAAAQQIINRCHLRGIRIIGGTLPPYEGAPYFSVNGDQTRKAFNQWIRNNGLFDAVIDFEQAVQDPGQADRFLPAYDSGDHLHPSDTGYAAMAEAAARVVGIRRVGKRKSRSSGL
jgi:lysophospholipase L1-like esterase